MTEYEDWKDEKSKMKKFDVELFNNQSVEMRVYCDECNEEVGEGVLCEECCHVEKCKCDDCEITRDEREESK